MNYSVYKFNLDLASIGSQVYLTMKQGDTGRSLFITLSNKGQPYEIEDGCIAVFAAKKPDGNIIFNNCVIENNIIHYEVTPQTSAAVGELACEIQLYKNGKLISSPCFATLVNPAVYPESELIESVTEVNTLAELLSYAQTMLINGGFIPKLSVGSVETLPAGSFATVEITGTGEAPVLNFGIPQGIQGQAEHLIPDTELLVDSTKPVQNRAIALKFADVEENIAENAAAIATKVGKENGKGLSANDFTDAYKQKLDGIEAGANKYVLRDGTVTVAKIADTARTHRFPVRISTDWVGSAAPYTYVAMVDEITADDIVKVFFSAPEDFNNLENEQEAFAHLYDVESENGRAILYAKEKPISAFSVMLEVSRI